MARVPSVHAMSNAQPVGFALAEAGLVCGPPFLSVDTTESRSCLSRALLLSGGLCRALSASVMRAKGRRKALSSAAAFKWPCTETTFLGPHLSLIGCLEILHSRMRRRPQTMLA